MGISNHTILPVLHLTTTLKQQTIGTKTPDLYTRYKKYKPHQYPLLNPVIYPATILIPSAKIYNYQLIKYIKST